MADRAALDLAIEKGILHGGWIPKGRLTENGPMLEKYSFNTDFRTANMIKLTRISAAKGKQ